MALSSSFVNSPASVSQLVDCLTKLPAGQTSVYISSQASPLFQKSTMSILQLLVHPQNHVYLIDVYTLGKTAFTEMGMGGETLGSILESDTVLKAFFDVRWHSHLLYTRFGVALQGVQEIQLMEAASHSPPIDTAKYAKSLLNCVREDASMTPSEMQNWGVVNLAAKRLYDPPLGGSWQVFLDRPLKEDIRSYCVQNLQYLPHLHKLYWDRLVKLGRERTLDNETRMRVRISQDQSFDASFPPNPWQMPQNLEPNNVEVRNSVARARPRPSTMVDGLKPRPSFIPITAGGVIRPVRTEGVITPVTAREAVRATITGGVTGRVARPIRADGVRGPDSRKSFTKSSYQPVLASTFRKIIRR